MRRLKILTWHTHGGYLYYLTQAPHDFFVLSKPGRPPGYTGRSGTLPWGENVHDMPASRLEGMRFDCVLMQDDPHLEDLERLLSPEQRRLPKVYLEHDPPRESPTDTRHPVDDPDVMLVHVTPFNRLMWDSGRTPTRVIEHGVLDPGYRYTGELERGLVVVNNLGKRGRRLGLDVFRDARRHAPLDLVGMGSRELGGLGEVEHAGLAGFSGRYRFLFNPIRWTSLGLAVIEAMMAGLPVVALATTEMATVVDNGVNGYADTSPDRLFAHMKTLLAEKDQAASMGRKARSLALERFGIGRFVEDWNRVLSEVAG